MGELDNPEDQKLAQQTAEIFGSDKAAGKMKEGGARARRSGNVVVAPNHSEDMGFAAATS